MGACSIAVDSPCCSMLCPMHDLVAIAGLRLLLRCWSSAVFILAHRQCCFAIAMLAYRLSTTCRMVNYLLHALWCSGMLAAIVVSGAHCLLRACLPFSRSMHSAGPSATGNAMSLLLLRSLCRCLLVPFMCSECGTSLSGSVAFEASPSAVML